MTSVVRQASKAVFAGLDLLSRPLTGPRILIYHQIGGGSGLEMEVTVEAFHAHVDWLADNHAVKHIDQALEDGDGVVLTFDDGYRSLYESAYPLLRERDLPFTLYLTTVPVETGRPMRDHPGAEPLNWGMVKSMLASELMTLGAHTHTHPDLRSIAADSVERECATSDELIVDRTGVTPRHFAYPWGYWSPESDGVVRARYRTATLGSPRPRTRLDDEHLIHRLPVQLSDGSRWFGPRVTGGLLFEESLRRRLRGYEGP